jgi:hypothetical protein
VREGEEGRGRGCDDAWGVAATFEGRGRGRRFGGVGGGGARVCF